MRIEWVMGFLLFIFKNVILLVFFRIFSLDQKKIDVEMYFDED